MIIRKHLLPAAFTILLVGLIVLSLLVPVTCSTSRVRVIPIQISADESSGNTRHIAVTIRYYAQDSGGQALATEQFRDVPLGFGGYSVDLGSSATITDGTAEWESAAGAASLSALLQTHGQLWYSVTLAGHHESTQRHRLNPANLKHCAC